MSKKQGPWPVLCLQRAFVEGAAWWQFTKNGSTMFSSERKCAEEEAVRGYGEPGTDPIAAAEERGRRAGIEEAIGIAGGFGTFGQGLVKQLRTLLRHDAEPPKRATVAELEAILALPDDALEVYVLPNGEVRARPRIALAPRDSGTCMHGFQRNTPCVYCEDRK